MVASQSTIVLLLLFSSVGFAAELSLTLLNDAVDKVQITIIYKPPPSLADRHFFYRARFAWMDRRLDIIIGKVNIKLHYGPRRQ